jgi:ABC-2 type transport system ATP-binding protein
MNIISLHQVDKQFQNLWALQKVDLSIKENTVFGLLGPNGAGKTTLLRIITSIFAPDHGQIYFKGKIISETNRPRIGYLPEERGLYKKMKVGEHLIYLAQLNGLSYQNAKQNTLHWLRKLGLEARENQKIEQLSKGLQQIVQFIATVIHNPEIVILDEPFSGFDPINADLIKNEILEMRKNGKTIIISTHRMESVEALCEDIALLNKGKIVLEGNKNEIKKSFSNQQYIVSGIGEVQHLNCATIISHQTQEAVQTICVKLVEKMTLNNVLQALIQQGFQIQCVEEQLPSIHDIFIEKINTHA